MPKLFIYEGVIYDLEVTLTMTDVTQYSGDESPIPYNKRRQLQQLFTDITDAFQDVNITPESIYHLLYTTLYPPPFFGYQGIANHYIGPYGPSSSTGLFVPDTIIFTPLYIPFSIHVIELGVWITTRDDAKQARLGIYSVERGKISNLVYSNVIALNTTEYRCVQADVHLDPGTYMLALNSNSSTAAARIASVSNGLSLPSPTPNWSTPYTSVQLATSYNDGFPATVDSDDLVAVTTDPIRVLVKLG